MTQLIKPLSRPQTARRMNAAVFTAEQKRLDLYYIMIYNSQFEDKHGGVAVTNEPPLGLWSPLEQRPL